MPHSRGWRQRWTAGFALRRPSAAAGAAPQPVAGLVGGLGGDARPTQMRPDCLRGASRIYAPPFGPNVRVPTAEARAPDPGHHGLELRCVAPLPGGNHQRQRLLIVLAAQVQRDRPPRTPQRAIAGPDAVPPDGSACASPWRRAGEGAGSCITTPVTQLTPKQALGPANLASAVI